MTLNRRLATKIGGWIALLPLLFLTAVSLIKYATWSVVVSGYTGLPSQQALLSHATHLANLWLCCLATAEIIATIILFMLLPARWRLLRLLVPVLAVPLVTGVVAWVLLMVGHQLR
jgi:hypothetical protein